jgi:hypothetical protein
MARGYRAREDGLFEVETPGLGFVPVHWGEDQLRAQGLEPLSPPSGRQAFVGDTPVEQGPPPAGGQAAPRAPESRLDAGKPSTVAGEFSRYLETTGGETPAEEFPASFRDDRGATPGVRSLLEGKSASDLILEKAREKLPESDPAAEKKGPRTEEYRPGGGAANFGGGAGAGRPRYSTTKARDVRAAWRVDKGPQLDPENEEFRSEAEIDTRLNMQERADREEERALRNVEEYEKRVLAPQARQISTDELKLDRMRQEYAKRQKEIDDERAAVDKLEVDPNRIFAEKGAWASVLAGISILAGGALQGLQGRGNNPGLDAVNAAIDRDIQLQKDKYARRREGLREKETAYERLMNTYGNPEMAEAELRNRQSALAEAWAKRHAMKSGAEDVQANLQQAFNERDLARVEERRQLDQAFGDRISEQWQHVPAQTVQVGGPRPLKPDARKRIVTLPDGRRAFAVDEQVGQKSQEQVKFDARIADAAQRLVHLRSQPGAKTDPELRGQIEGAAADLFIGLKSGANLGTLDKGSLDFRTEWTGNPNDLIDMGGADAKLKEVARAAKGRISDTINYNLYADPDATQPLGRPGPTSARSDE